MPPENCSKKIARKLRGYASDGNMLLGGGTAYGVKSIRSRNKYLKINLMDLISVIPNPDNRVTFSYKARNFFFEIIKFRS